MRTRRLHIQTNTRLLAPGVRLSESLEGVEVDGEDGVAVESRTLTNPDKRTTTTGFAPVAVITSIRDLRSMPGAISSRAGTSYTRVPGSAATDSCSLRLPFRSGHRR